MKSLLQIICILLIASCTFAQASDPEYVAANYDYAEHFIPMRDGVKLFTMVYSPKDKSKKHPFLMKRTCYNASRALNNKLGINLQFTW